MVLVNMNFLSQNYINGSNMPLCSIYLSIYALLVIIETQLFAKFRNVVRIKTRWDDIGHTRNFSSYNC